MFADVSIIGLELSLCTAVRVWNSYKLLELVDGPPSRIGRTEWFVGTHQEEGLVCQAESSMRRNIGD